MGQHKRKGKLSPETGRAQGSNLAPQTSADANTEKHAFWFSDDFDESAKNFINDHLWPEATNFCYFESVRWSDLLRKNGFNAEIKLGWYRVDVPTSVPAFANGSCFHSWVVVDGKIFDPTFSQFNETPSSTKYRTESTVGCWQDLVELALSLAPAFLYFPETTGAKVSFSWPVRELETNSASDSTTENQPVNVPLAKEIHDEQHHHQRATQRAHRQQDENPLPVYRVGYRDPARMSDRPDEVSI